MVIPHTFQGSPQDAVQCHTQAILFAGGGSYQSSEGAIGVF